MRLLRNEKTEEEMNRLKESISHPLVKRIYWILFGILFFISGESFLFWLLEPEKFSGGYRWVFVFIFPVAGPVSFYINKKLGCSACQTGSCDIGNKTDDKKNDDFLIGTGQMP